MSKRAWKLVCYPLPVILGICLLLPSPEVHAQASSPLDELSPIADLDGFEMVEEELYTPTLPADCGMGCPSSWYVHADAFFMARESHLDQGLSRSVALGEYAYELGSRVTVGRRRDCLEGWEASYVGPLRWESAVERSGFPLDSGFVVPGGAINISAFNGAEFHRQTSRSTLHSFEVNQRCRDWDTLSGLVGFRYLNIEDEFTFFSRDPLPAADEGFFAVSTRNHLIGVQGGFDLFYNVGASGRLSLIGKTKLGLYGSFTSGDALLVNAGTVELNNSASNARLAFLGEIGYYARFQVLPRLFVRGGYEVWCLAGFAHSHRRSLRSLSPSIGNNVDSGYHAWFHGGTVGLEFVW